MLSIFITLQIEKHVNYNIESFMLRSVHTVVVCAIGIPLIYGILNGLLEIFLWIKGKIKIGKESAFAKLDYLKCIKKR